MRFCVFRLLLSYSLFAALSFMIFLLSVNFHFFPLDSHGAALLGSIAKYLEVSQISSKKLNSINSVKKIENSEKMPKTDPRLDLKNGYNSAKMEQKNGTGTGTGTGTGGKINVRRNSSVMLAGDLEYLGKKYLLANPGKI